MQDSSFKDHFLNKSSNLKKTKRLKFSKNSDRAKNS